METTSEANAELLDNFTSERVETTSETYQSTSIDGKIVEESRSVTYESTPEVITTGDQFTENNSIYPPVEEASSNLEANKTDTVVNIENSIGEAAEQITDIVEDGTGNNSVENQESLKVSEETATENQIEDNVETVISNAEETPLVEESQTDVLEKEHQEEQKGDPNEYANEYLLENQGENVYMPDQEVVKPNLEPENVYATEMISDDSQDNATVLRQGSEQQSSVTVTEIIEENDDPQPGTGNSEEETLPTLIEMPDDQPTECSADETRQDSVKIESADNAENYDNVSEVDNQSVDGSVGNEPSVSGNLVVEEIPEDRTVEDVHLKQEIRSTDVQESQPDTARVQEAKLIDQPEEQEQILEVNNEGIENVQIENVQASSADNIPLGTYTLSESFEATDVQEEYTIVEGPSSIDISATQQIDEANADSSLILLENYEGSDENSLMQISDEQQESYLVELRDQVDSRQSTSSQPSDNKPRRGRRPTYDLPMHVLGHNISKPVETVPNGRALPKPRLGVKVPYRNLTSQIVSKAEIEKEIMERARLKQEQANARGDVLFARKLTQRLARKIAPSPNHPKRVVSVAPKPKETETQSPNKETDVVEAQMVESADPQPQDTSKIHNDSDLLAILEGEGEEMPVLPKEVTPSNTDETNLKMLEREIALQQLQELPHQAPKQRIFRGRQTKAPVLTAEVQALAKTKSPERTSTSKETASTVAVAQNAAVKPNTDPPRTHSDKENTSKQPVSKDPLQISPKRDQSRIDLPSSPMKQPVEIEPQVKVNMVLKTYSRKRKTVELSEPFPESPVAKKPMLSESEIKVEKSDSGVPPDGYVTKSSRIIKKKVIWDPDEIPVRSPKPTGKTESQVPKATPPKPTKPVEKAAEKVVEKKPVADKVVKEKLPEKKQVEKPTPKKTSNEKHVSPEKKPPKSESPKPGKTPLKNKKVRSEVDKLLMDEGAVKMLYELKTTDDAIPPKKKKDVYSVERAQKEIIKKANEIKSDLQQNTSNESPKSLRKKEAIPTPVKPGQIPGSGERKMSKDSTRSSLHTPPGSPPYSFSHSQSSMLIRRRSSSSISSSDEVSTDDGTKLSRKRSVGSSDAPRPKKAKKVEEPKEPTEPENATKESPTKHTTAESKLNQFKSFTVKKTSKHVIIDLNYINEKCYCTVQVLEELTAALKKYARDKDCNVVSITSSSKAFCLGLDYVSLVSDDEDVRKKTAAELAGRVRDFLLCLLNFPKVLIAGIQGACVGIGVTMLPLFDMVIASDKATFSTSYASIGCVAEAGFLLSSPHMSNHGLATELLFTTQKLTADDAFRRGLISKLCWPEKYNETFKNIVVSVSKGSKQSLEATKKQLRRHIVSATEAAITSDSKLLIEHWTSAECQRNFAKLIEDAN